MIIIIKIIIESRRRNSDRVRNFRKSEGIICVDKLRCEPRRLEVAVHAMALSESVSEIERT